MTIDLTAADRPIPDESDIRLLHELVANVSIPLANAAANAQMPQAEAALRLVSMFDRGLPLRLVADGDRGALWQLVQAGPVTVTPPAPPIAAAPEAPVAPAAAADPTPPEVAPSPEPAAPVSIPVADLPDIAPPAEPAAVVPTPEPAALGLTPEPVVESAAPEPAPVANPAQEAAPPPAAAEPAPIAATWATHPILGPAGEQLAVTILEVVDPAPRSTIIAGAPVIDGYRAVLVRSQVANTGQVPYPVPGDANLVLETDQRILIGRAGPPPAELPAFPGGVNPGEAAEGWSLFAVTDDTRLAGLKWCIRPDIPQTIVGWPITPVAS